MSKLCSYLTSLGILIIHQPIKGSGFVDKILSGEAPWIEGVQKRETRIPAEAEETRFAGKDSRRAFPDLETKEEEETTFHRGLWISS